MIVFAFLIAQIFFIGAILSTQTPPQSENHLMRKSLFTNLKHGYLMTTSLLLTSQSSIAAQKDVSCKDKVFLVTGSTDGIGKHTATQIAKSGGILLLHGRNKEKIEDTKKTILSMYPQAVIKSYCYDLSNISNVKSFAKNILEQNSRLDSLINNAGIFASEYSITPDDLEETFAVNVVAPFILSTSLLPLLKRTTQSRILNVASTSQEEGDPRIILDNLQFQKGGFSDHAAYSLSKLCMAAMSHELALRVPPEDTLVISCDPGDVDTQMLRRGWAGYQGIPVNTANNEYILATAPYDRSHHGKYYVNCRETKCNKDVYNDKLRIGLWKELERIVA